MGASFGSSETGSRNVELNIVPFIDLMSCLTAFLLVTAVWVNISSLDNAPTGRGRQEQPPEDPNDKPRLGILIEENQLSLTLYPAGVTQQVGAYNWAGLESALREYRTAQELPPIEVAADSTRAHPIEYRHVIAAMDTAAKVGFPTVGVVDAAQLTR
jgi:biopolymer transport protein ExbD